MRRSDWGQITPALLYCCMAFNFGNILFGIDVGSFGSLQALPSWLRSFGVLQNGTYMLPTERRSIMNSVVWIGKLIGTASFEPLLERLGYKKVIYIVCLIQVIGIVIELSATEWIQFSVGRIIAYIAVGIVENAVPSYEAELAPAGLRGFLAGNVQVFVHVGSIWGASMSYAFRTEIERIGWIIPVAVQVSLQKILTDSQLLPPLLLIATVPFCIESPRWLISKGRKDEALSALNRIRPARVSATGVTSLEVQAVEDAMNESYAMGQAGWMDLFRPKYIQRTIIIALVFFFNQTTGQQFANSYGPSFFTSIGLGLQSFQYSILIAMAGLFGCLVAVATTDIIGRRYLCIIGATLAIMFSALIGGIGPLPNRTTDQNNVVIASVILLNGVCKLGVASQCWLIGSEIGGIQMRKRMIGWATSIDVLAAFLVTFCTPYLQAGPQIQMGARVGFVFMGCAAIALFFFIFFLPELKGRSLEEVDDLFKRNLWAWQFSKAETRGPGAELADIGSVHEDKRHEKEAEA